MPSTPPSPPINISSSSNKNVTLNLSRIAAHIARNNSIPRYYVRKYTTLSLNIKGKSQYLHPPTHLFLPPNPHSNPPTHHPTHHLPLPRHRHHPPRHPSILHPQPAIPPLPLHHPQKIRPSRPTTPFTSRRLRHDHDTLLSLAPFILPSKQRRKVFQRKRFRSTTQCQSRRRRLRRPWRLHPPLRHARTPRLRPHRLPRRYIWIPRSRRDRTICRRRFWERAWKLARLGNLPYSDT